MNKVEGTTITLTRGDTFIASIIPTRRDGSRYEFQEGDSMRFAMKRKYTDEEPAILKNIPIEEDETDPDRNLVGKLQIEPEDTKQLKCCEYVYDIELTTAAGDVDTFIAEAKFILAPEVH